MDADKKAKLEMWGEAMVDAQTNEHGAAFLTGLATFGGGLRAVGSTFGIGGKWFARIIVATVLVLLLKNGGRELLISYLGG